MESNSLGFGRLFKLPRAMLVGGLLLSLALVALACSPAEEPAAPAAPAAVATEAPAPVVADEPVVDEEEEEEVVVSEQTGGTTASTAAVTSKVETRGTSDKGTYREVAGLSVFIPDGYSRGGPIIPSDGREPQRGGIANYAQPGDPPSTDPYHTTSTYMTGTSGRSYERLIHLPAAAGINRFEDIRIGGLAESWEWGEDFLSLKFNLRQGVKWHNIAPVNGREFDSEDVKWTFEKFSHPESIQKGFYANVDSVSTPDKYTAIYNLNSVDLNLFAVLSDPGRGFMLPRESDEINRRITGIGTGAFMFDGDYEYKLGVDFVANPDYWGKDEAGRQLPFLSGVKVRVIGDATARCAAFRTGKVDYGCSISNVEGADALLKTNPTTIIQEYTLPYSTANTGFRHDKEPWNDVRVRRAMALSVDWDAMSRALFGVPANPWVGISGAWYGEATNDLATLNGHTSGAWYSYDPERAKALLTEAGFPDGLSTTLEYFPYNPSHTEAHELKQAYWKEVGIDVEIKSLDYSVFRANLDNGSWTDIGGWTFIYPYASSMEGAILDLKPGYGQNENTGFINDPILADLVDQVMAAYADEAKRKDLVKQIRARYLDQVYSLPWPWGNTMIPFAPRLRDFNPNNSALVSSDMRPYNYAWIDDTYAFN